MKAILASLFLAVATTPTWAEEGKVKCQFFGFDVPCHTGFDYDEPGREDGKAFSAPRQNNPGILTAEPKAIEVRDNCKGW